jgi:sterol desaturase/sphingolipid hydroxylase (fatty acid hydroxylase superfamily)
MVDTLELMALGCVPAAMGLDLFIRRRRYDAPRFWRLQGLAVSVAVVAFSFAVLGVLGGYLPAWSLLDGAALGTAGGAIAGILVYELAHYWYHRLVHRSDRLFRWCHQMHHSAESLDAFGANYTGPIDVIAFTMLPVLVVFPLLGLTAPAAAIVGLFIAFNAAFQHANIATPRWVGYLIQRPESHGVHHQRGWHRQNYSDLPLWDMVFGTFHNPDSFDGEVGFYNGGSRRIPAMLVGRDVSAAPPQPVIAIVDDEQAEPPARLAA